MDSSHNIRAIFTAPTMLVKVGPSDVEYYVHKDLAAKHSQYFSNVARPGLFLENVTGTVTLSDVDVLTFESFIYWLYTEKLPEDVENSAEGLTSFYVFADRFFVPSLQTQIVGKAVELANKSIFLPPYSAIIYAFSHLPEQSFFLDLLSDAFCKHWDGNLLKDADLFEELPLAFIAKVMKRFNALKKSSHNTLSISTYKNRERGENESPSNNRKRNRFDLGREG